MRGILALRGLGRDIAGYRIGLRGLRLVVGKVVRTVVREGRAVVVVGGGCRDGSRGCRGGRAGRDGLAGLVLVVEAARLGGIARRKR